MGGLALLALLEPSAAWGHAGVEASAFVIDPDRPGLVADRSFRFRWRDASDVGTATASTTHSFYFSTYLPPPWPVFAPPAGLQGTVIAEDVPEADPTNALTWRTTDVPAGAYWIWSIADDPDVLVPSQTIVFSPFPLVVQHAGDPLSPFVTLQTPDSPAAFAEGDRYEVRYVAYDPDGTGVVTLERALDGSTEFVPVALDLPAVEDGRLELDTSTWPVGDYVLRARLVDGRGLEFSAFARYTLLVARRTRADAGIDAGPDGGAPLDAGVAPDASAPPEAPGDGCRCAAHSAVSPSWWLLVALPIALRRARAPSSPPVSTSGP